MSPVVRRYVDTPEGQVHLRERPGDGPVVVLLHQTPSSAVMWEPVMAVWPAGARLLALDTPGFGVSDPPSALPADGMAYYARRVVGVLDALGLERVHLVGHHTGAMIAAEVAVSAPERIERLALLGTVLVTKEEGEDYMAHGVTRWTADPDLAFIADAIVPRLRQAVTTGDPHQIEVELAAHLEAGPDWWWVYAAVFGYDGHARLPLVRAPTLVAVGADEAEPMRVWTKGTADLIPGAEYRELPGVGVEMTFQDPGLTMEAVRGFLEAA